MGATAFTTSAANAPATSRTVAIPWQILAVLFASTSIVVGVIWDISWHMTIGRDTFWTPAHMAMYVGGVVAGIASGITVLRTTFAGSAADRARSVRFWGFRGPLGAWVSIWGALAMLTSAPLDDWWHNAYGLDVEILSPPHVVLALGMVAIALGAMLYVLALQNREEVGERSRVPMLFAYASGIVLTFFALMATEYTDRVLMHSSLMYRVACAAFPLVLVAAARASRLRWAATATALAYMAIVAGMMWILPLFPAQPRLGPIYQDVTHMVPMNFPLLLIAPAFLLDLAAHRSEGRSDWTMAAAYGLCFFVAFLVTQFAFSYFLMSPYSINPLFATDNYFYGLPKTSFAYRREFVPLDATPGTMRSGLIVAAVLAIVSARVGLWWGAWMRRVRR